MSGPGQSLYDAVQQMEHDGLIFDGSEGEPEGAILRSFVCVAEFIGTDGERWLATIRWGMDGREPPIWETVGLMESVAYDLKHQWAVGPSDPSE